MGEQRQREAAHAAVGERDGVVEVAIGHDGRNRAERLAIVDRGVFHGSSLRSRIGSRKAPPATPGEASGSPETIRAPAATSLPIWLRTSSRWAFETSAPIRDSLSRGSPTLVALEPFADRCFDRVEMLGRRHGAADRGAFLPRLDRHLGHDFLDEQVELGRSRRGVGAEQRGVEAVLLGDELDAFALHDGVRAQLERGRGRAGEADHVLPGQMVEQVADPADDQLHRSRREHAGFDHDLERGFGQIGGRRGRFDDRRHAREQGRRELLEHPPDRES